MLPGNSRNSENHQLSAQRQIIVAISIENCDTERSLKSYNSNDIQAVLEFVRIYGDDLRSSILMASWILKL
jgi:hypothetical protein